MNDDETWKPHEPGPSVVRETKMPAKQLAQRGALWIAIFTLAIAVIMLIITANQVIGTWLRPQYVPIARFVVSLAFASGALGAIWGLTRSR